MTLARPASALASVVVVAVMSLGALTGCSGKDTGTDLYDKTDPTQPTPPNDAGPDVTTCEGIAPACDPGDDNVGSESACSGYSYCYSRSTSCGDSLVWCGHRQGVQCNAYPACDAGDMQVGTCPAPPPGPGGGGDPGFTCYPRTACGTTIECVHQTNACKGPPACMGGDQQVVDPSICKQANASCYFSSACGVTIECYTLIKP